MNIVFVKHGDKYSAAHVNTLYDQLLSFYPDATYHCYTEKREGINDKVHIIPIFTKPSLRRWWNKLALFSEDINLEGQCLYFDLDMKIIRDPRPFITSFDYLTVIESYWKLDNPVCAIKHNYDVYINSSIIAWTAGNQNHIWDHFCTNKDYFMRKYAGIDRFLVHEKMQHKTFPDGLINSINNRPNRSAAIDMYNGIYYEL